MGFESARAFYLKGATVVLAVRNVKKVQQECQELKESLKDLKLPGELVVMVLDLADLQSVKEFNMEFLQRFDRLDILLNNAGVGQPNALSL